VNILKKNLPISIAFVMGILGIITYYSPLKTAADLTSDLANWERIISGFALVVGIYSLLNHHYHKLKKKVPGWGFSVIVFIGMIIMVIAGFSFRMDVPEKDEFGTWTESKQRSLLTMNGIELTDDPAAVQSAQEAALAAGEVAKIALDTQAGRLDATELIARVPIMWLYDFIFVPMQATMFSLLAFYIASAAYRAFRARTVEATVLLATAIVGEAIWHKFPQLTDWILSIPSMAAQRGVMMGIGLGMISTSLRIIFGIERTYMGGGGD
jgi:hypothetical protein